MIICWCQGLILLKRFNAWRKTCFSNPAHLFCIFLAQVSSTGFESLIPSNNRLTIEEDGCKPSPFRRCFFGAKLVVVEFENMAIQLLRMLAWPQIVEYIGVKW